MESKMHLGDTTFDKIINDGNFLLKDAGPLFNPITRLRIGRDKDLKIVLETWSHPDATAKRDRSLPGTVRQNLDEITLENPFGSRAIGVGIQSTDILETTSYVSASSERQETSLLSSIEIYTNDGEELYVIDWFVSRKNHYVWPDGINENGSQTGTTTIGRDDHKIEIPFSRTTYHWSNSSTNFYINGCRIYLCTNRSSDDRLNLENGFIIYSCPVTEGFRRAIRSCISFALGTYLVYLGDSSYNESWDLLRTKAVSAYSIDNRVFSVPVLPPAPLSYTYENSIDAEVFEQIVTALYKHYIDLGLATLFWAYWHALCTISYVSAPQYGAIIEAIQTTYRKKHPDTIFTTLITDKNLASEVLGILRDAVLKTDLDEDIKRVMTNKLSGMNSTPKDVLTERTFAILNLTIGAPERAAWKQRNRIAHGSFVADGDFIELIRDVKLLKIIFHRIVLRLTNASEYYCDYYSVGFPNRKLADPAGI
jgi:hypothetical protein